MDAVQALAGKLATVIINPILALMFGIGAVVFVWGLVQYLYSINVRGKADDQGKKHMIFGIIGMFIMVAVFSIIRIIANTINVQLPSGY